MFKFKMWPVLATGLLVLSAGSFAVADDDDDDDDDDRTSSWWSSDWKDVWRHISDNDDDDDEDENEVSVEVEATNDDGYKLEIEAEGTSLGFIDGFIDDPDGFIGDLRGEAKLTDPDGNECEVEIAGSNNGVVFTPMMRTVIGRLLMFAESGQPLVLIRYNESMTVRINRPSQPLFSVLGCDVPDFGPIIFPGDQTEVEIEEG